MQPRLIVAIAVVLLSTAGLAAAQDRLEGPARVIDGDTLAVAGIRVRLFGIDAPEKDQPCGGGDGLPYACGKVAAVELAERIGVDPVSCRPRTTDRYHRVVAVCVDAKGDDLAAWMVESGFAIAYRQYSTVYVAAEDRARRAGRGIWIGPFMAPADWRAIRHPPGP